MKILFICLSNLKFDVRTPYDKPLGGTESAIAYLSVELAKLGHAVTLMCNSPAQKLDSVDHMPVSEDIAGLNPDVVILVSAPQAAPGVKAIVPQAKLILWNHLMPDQPAIQHIFKPESNIAIDHIVYVSEKQRKVFAETAKALKSVCSVDGGTTEIIGNAISPCFENMFSSAAEILAVKKCRGVYTSTPFRGLAALATIKEIPIDVFSSMAVYQTDDAPFATMYASLKANDCLDMHGSVSQTALAQHLHQTAFLVYPSIFSETFGIVIYEAMAAGLKVVTTDMASPQTEYIDSMLATDGTIDAYAALLRKNVNAFRSRPEVWAETMWKQVQYVNSEFTWVKRAREWDAYLRSVTADLKPRE